MRSKRSFLIFITFFLSVSGFASFLLWQFIKLGFPVGIKTFGLIWSLFPIYIASEIARRQEKALVFNYLVSIIVGTYSIAVGVCVFGYVAILVGVPAKLVIMGSGVIIFILSMIAFILDFLPPEVKTIHLNLNKSLTIVQIADTHIVKTTRLSWLQAVVDKVNALEPDIILFTGDFIDVDPTHIQSRLNILKQIKAKHGIFAVSGNHEFYEGIHHFYALCKELGFKTLTNEVVKVAGIQIAGVPDEMSQTSGFEAASLEKIKQQLDPNLLTILLKHRPTNLKEVEKMGVTLQLSGHTHNGQIMPWGVLVRLRYGRFANGLNKYKKLWVYTSKGTGSWGPPMRLFTRAEITKIVI